MNSGIYKIINTENNKFYIGSAVNIQKRWNKHISDLKLNKHHSKYLQNSWNKYNEKSFKFEIVEICEECLLIEREQFYIDKLKPEYNICKIAGNLLGYKHTEETKAKISLKNKGKVVSDEVKIKIGFKSKGRFHSEETKLKRFYSRKGFKHSEETKLKISESNKNKHNFKPSEETKNKMSKSKIGNKNALGFKHSEENKIKMSENTKLRKNNLGKTWSEETKLKMSNSQKLRRENNRIFKDIFKVWSTAL